MPRVQLMMLGLQITWALFCFAFGACLGSLINVIVYRVPRGLSVVTPPSRCPHCQHLLSWRENIPVLGWLILRGKCRFCKAPISPEYPIVEAIVGGLFMLLYLVCYALPAHWTIFGIDFGAMTPDWFRYPNDAKQTWPTFVVFLFLVASLVAATLVDAKTSTIPLPIVWVPTVLALFTHTAHAIWAQTHAWHLHPAPGWSWAIPTPGLSGWGTIGLAIGGTIGLGFAMLLLFSRLITRSFADYAEWEERTKKEQESSTPNAIPEGVEAGAPLVQSTNAGDHPEDIWIMYPHARREMVKELAFLCPVVLLAIAGWKLAPLWAGTLETPLWLRVLSGVLLGYLIGGGVVWAVRIAGSVGFGREAMGLGDVHLMAAVGACLGWIDAVVAFFAAAFVGLGWVILGGIFGGSLRRAMPYGPYLAVATILVLLGKPVVETGLSFLLHQPVHLP
jgi:leader peptidase (prepilin peptidase)/N-methyltransferase